MQGLVLRISKQMGESEFMQRGVWEIMMVAAEDIQSEDCVDCMSEGEGHVDVLWRTLQPNHISLITIKS